MQNLKRNFGYQSIYQLLNQILPLITAPYLARVLGAAPLGVFSFTNSVVSFFVIFANLGFENYGTRSVASCREDKEKLSKCFCEIYFLRVITGILVLGAYIVYLLVVCKDNKLIALIQAIAVFSCIFDINWLFFGLENFRLTVTRNCIIRIITVVLILLLVNKPSDLWIYVLLMVTGPFISQIVLWFFIPKDIKFIKPNVEALWKHIKPTLALFAPILAMQIYHIMDKVMLGIFSNYEQSGYYYNADKIINIPLSIIFGLGTVILPRLSAMAHDKKNEAFEKTFIMYISAISWLSIAMTFGIAAISKEFTPLFFGSEFIPCTVLIISLSPVLWLKGMSTTVAQSYLIPIKAEKLYIYSVTCGAAINLLVNLILIPRLEAMGAVIGTIVAELVVTSIQLIVIHHRVNLKGFYFDCLALAIAGSIMFGVVRLSSRLAFGWITVGIEVLAGVVVYSGLSL